MNRTERRNMERAAQTFEQRKSFAPAEVVQMNNISYSLGAEHALEACAMAYGLGPKRLAQVKEKLRLLQQLDFECHPDVIAAQKKNMHLVKMNREQRRAKEKSKKGAVLFEK